MRTTDRIEITMTNDEDTLIFCEVPEVAVPDTAAALFDFDGDAVLVDGGRNGELSSVVGKMVVGDEGLVETDGEPVTPMLVVIGGADGTSIQ